MELNREQIIERLSEIEISLKNSDNRFNAILLDEKTKLSKLLTSLNEVRKSNNLLLG